MIYGICRLIAVLVSIICFRVHVKGRLNIPERGRCILVANHTSNYDPVELAELTYRRVNYIGKAELMKNGMGKWLFSHLGMIPVNRQNPSPRSAIDCMRVLKEDKILGIFPEATRVKGERLKPHDGFVMFAIKTHAPIIPIHISGKFRFGHRVNIVIGEPIELSEYYGSKPDGEKLSELAQNIMDKIYDLK